MALVASTVGDGSPIMADEAVEWEFIDSTLGVVAFYDEDGEKTVTANWDNIIAIVEASKEDVEELQEYM